MMKFAPGPRKLSEMISLLRLRSKSPIAVYNKLFAQYGSMAFVAIGKVRILMLNDADAIEQVLQTNAKDFTKSSGYERLKMVVGNGLLTSEGEFWRKQRKLSSFAFQTKNIENIQPLMAEETIKLIKSWSNEQEMDLCEEMNKVTLSVIGRSLFGLQMNAQEIRSNLKTMLDYLRTTRHFILRLLVSMLPVKNKQQLTVKLEMMLPFKDTKEFLKASASLYQVVDRMIEERKKLNEHTNLLDALIHATDEDDNSQMTPAQLRDEVVTMLIAGHETTANALSWTWHLLLNHPEQYRKVKEEVNQYIKNDQPTIEDLNKLVYTKACFEESIRLYPPFWRIARQASKDMKINGFDVPKGSNIVCASFNIHRNPVYWKDPSEFRPERFLGEQNHHKFAYIPFGAGPRICIGMNFSHVEALSILSLCVKHCDFETKEIGEPEYFMSITLQPKHGYKAKMKKRVSL